MLHSEILTRLKHAPPRRSSRGTFVESRKTPAYIVSPPDPHTASITLGRLLDEEACSSNSSRAIPGSIPETLSERVQGDNHVSSEDRLETLLAMDEKGHRMIPHVLLTVALEEDQIQDAASCARWLKQFPLLAKFVSVEGVYRSYSTLLLLSVPVVLWDLLPDHAATQFVGYIQSRNLVPRNELQKKTTTPIPITGQSAREKTGSTFDCTSPLKSVSGLSSLDSGYDSSSISRPASLGTTRLARKTTDGLGRLRNTLSSQVLMEKRPSIRYVSDLVNPNQATSALANITTHTPEEKQDMPGRRAKRLIVTITEAYLNDLGDDIPELTCVLWYGHDVQHRKLLRRPTAESTWNEEFRFEVDDSPMFYHLRLCMWVGQMVELIGELQIDLRSLVQMGRLPELRDWQALRRDGRTTGEIRIGLAYLSAREDGKRHMEASKSKATLQQQQQQQQQRHDEGQTRVEDMDFPVW